MAVQRRNPQEPVDVIQMMSITMTCGMMLALARALTIADVDDAMATARGDEDYAMKLLDSVVGNRPPHQPFRHGDVQLYFEGLLKKCQEIMAARFEESNPTGA